MAVVHPILDYIARSACSTLPLRSMVAVVLPPLGQNHSSDGGGRHWRFASRCDPYHERSTTIRKTPTMAVPGRISRPEKAAFNPA